MSGICLAKAPLGLSLQARLGELASQRVRIRERIRLGEGTLLQLGTPRLPLPSASAGGCGHWKLQARQGELAGRGLG